MAATNSKIHKGLELEVLGESTSDLAEKTQRIDTFCAKYKINPQFATRLSQLAEYQIVIIADDSGSMNSASDANVEGIVTRWDELKKMTCLLIELCTIFDEDGIDVHFLNREAVCNIKNPKDKRLAKACKSGPNGTTPTCDVLQHILQSPSDLPRIIFIITDGLPTSADGHTNEVSRLRNILQRRNADHNYVSIVACTGDDNVIGYLNQWDVQIKNLDVIDDYNNERREILHAQGNNFAFNYGDYVVKAVLGPIDPWFDRLDEPANGRYPSRGDGCCAIL